MYTKEKIHQYAEFKKITLFEFEKKAGISSGTMRKGKDFGASLVVKIRNNFPDLNINWSSYTIIHPSSSLICPSETKGR